jgi:hypothetical protein
MFIHLDYGSPVTSTDTPANSGSHTVTADVVAADAGEAEAADDSDLMGVGFQTATSWRQCNTVWHGSKSAHLLGGKHVVHGYFAWAHRIAGAWTAAVCAVD